METRQLGSGGPRLSVIGLGCNNFGMRIDQEASAAVIHAALDAGVTHIDTAEGYGGGKSEEFIGDALVGRRDEVTIATKFQRRPDGEPYEPGLLRRRIRDGIETSLRRLRTDHVDLYYQHFPDPVAPVDEALEVMHELVAEGKVRHIASSNVGADQMRTAASVAADHQWTPFCGTQLEWSLLKRQVETEAVPAARDLGLGIVTYYPLASGLLTGKYRKGQPMPEGSRLEASAYFAEKVVNDENLDHVERLIAYAESRDLPLLDLAIAWLLAQDGVTSVICGATKPSQVQANAAAASRTLTADDVSGVP